MTSNYIVNASNVASQAIDGNLDLLSGTLARLNGHKTVVRSDYETYKNERVVTISGGRGWA